MMVRLAPVLVRFRRGLIGALTLDTDDLGGHDADADHGIMTPRLADLAR